jgi:hypothetical protein
MSLLVKRSSQTINKKIVKFKTSIGISLGDRAKASVEEDLLIREAAL